MITKIFSYLLMLGTCCSTYAAEITLCKADEAVAFSCPLSRKIVSVCTSKSTSTSTSKFLEYRFGRINNVEMKYRADGNSQNRFIRAHQMFSDTNYTFLWFKNNGMTYLLNAPDRGAPFLQVRQKGKVLANMQCNSGWESVTGDLDQSLPFVEDKKLHGKELQDDWANPAP